MWDCSYKIHLRAVQGRSCWFLSGLSVHFLSGPGSKRHREMWRHRTVHPKSDLSPGGAETPASWSVEWTCWISSLRDFQGSDPLNSSSRIYPTIDGFHPHHCWNHPLGLATSFCYFQIIIGSREENLGKLLSKYWAPDIPPKYIFLQSILELWDVWPWKSRRSASLLLLWEGDSRGGWLWCAFSNLWLIPICHLIT